MKAAELEIRQNIRYAGEADGEIRNRDRKTAMYRTGFGIMSLLRFDGAGDGETPHRTKQRTKFLVKGRIPCVVVL